MGVDILSVHNVIDFNGDLKLQGFKIYQIDTEKNLVRSYNRKDFYKICVITGHNVIQYADKGFDVRGTKLFFGNPLVPYSWENITEQTGYTCLFSESFLKGLHLLFDFRLLSPKVNLNTYIIADKVVVSCMFKFSPNTKVRSLGVCGLQFLHL